MKVGLFQQQSLKVMMTKELSQAISLLQYSALEISSFLQEQALQNPLIDFQDRSILVQKKTSRSTSVSGKAVSPIDMAAAKKETLHQHLLAQLSFMAIPPAQKSIVVYIINSLNDHGYLQEDIKDIGSVLNKELEEVERALRIVQQLEPIGSGARSLQECLLIQLQRKGICTSIVEEVLMGFFEEFAYKKWDKLAKRLGISIQDIQDIYDEVVLLNPRPGLQFGSDQEKFIVPDYVVQKEKGQIVLKSNDELNIQVKMNEEYKGVLHDKQNPELFTYLQEKYREFQWILKGLNNRKHTLDQVMRAIFHYQYLFFEKGPAYLKPLTMKELAEQIDVHESTVSRAIKNKYVQTPFGMFEMKSFFTNSIQSHDKQELSSSYVKTLIKQLIDQEDKRKPLSDQQISKKLEEEHGIVVSRRTVAKYREELHVLSSSKRKIYKST
ncbi:RNA polymerase factor sigma-54 [Bacillus songklensis]|uniref:RNA polymerase factor sigma-54 n=1 Tax=Bacillus songklensis TaxID=1069116 RepID=A0ABV8B9J6_9BACI